jgi:signal transduction histidine kinase
MQVGAVADKHVCALLVEDNHGDARLVQEALASGASHGGSRIDLEWVDRLSTGLERLRAGGVDVLLLDLNLPDSHGWSTVVEVRHQEPHVPIVVLTGVDDEDGAITAVQRGAQDYLVKGHVDSNVLRRCIRYAIERHRMLEGVQALNESLERRVLERTQELSRSNALLESEIIERKRTEEVLRTTLNELESRVAERTVNLKEANDQLQAEATDRERVEEMLEQQSRELTRSNAELEQFAYVASHDLQEPLRMVTSYLQLIQRRYRGKLDAEADEFIDFAVDGGTRMKSLIQDLLAYSSVRTDAGRFALADCGALLDRVVADDLQALVDESGATVTRDPLPTVMADEGQIRHLLRNLLSNAIKFCSDEPPRVHVLAKRNRNAEWAFSVRDTGIGIDPAHVKRVFGIFQRLHGRGEYPGTGLGLAICKRIVESHGGRIWVESEPGNGSTFWFTLAAKGGTHGQFD